MRESSQPFRVRIRGSLACFTRPEMKVERVSYEVITPSAARGVVEAVLWKPQIRWTVHAIEVLAPVRWASFRRNEVQSRASPNAGPIVADDDRTQRNTVALRDVDYVVETSFSLTEKAAANDSVAKYVAMFRRRIEKGQHHHAPYLGCREFTAEVLPAEGAPKPIDPGIDRPLGWMFYDWDCFPTCEGGSEDKGRPLFFEARLVSGVLRVPDREEVIALNGGRL